MIATGSLRQKLLALAIRGKLNSPHCTGAALDYISRAMQVGGVIDRKIVKDVPFPLPQGWEWCTLSDIAYVASGSTPPKECFVADGVPYLKMYNLRNQKVDFNYKPQYINPETHNGKLARSRAEPGDLIMNIVGPPLGKLAIVPPSLPHCNFNQAAVMIRPFVEKEVVNKYLFYYLSEMGELNSLETKGTAGQDNISLTQCRNLRIALPPLEEQKRIVARLEELLALEREIAADGAALDDLVAAARRKILDLAVSGKLVPRKGEWRRVRLGDVADVQLGKMLDKAKNIGHPFKYLANVNVRWRGFDLSDLKETLFDEKDVRKFSLCKGDLLMCEGGVPGRCAVWEEENSNIKYQKAIHRIRSEDCLSPYFLQIYFEAISDKASFTQCFTGSTIHHLPREVLVATVIPLPPLAEQKAIVKRVDELMALLDAMKG